ncbi:MAG: glucosamine-6-phosphate deaminase [Luteitalea sp.]|nr:glucosamine-6-phosphate deaminase [Luteitalea sp.]
MRIRIFGSPDQLAHALARSIAGRVAANAGLVLGLPTGDTPVPLYRELVALYRARRIDFSQTTTFNLDEFDGLGAGDSCSYRAFMQRHLFDHVNVPSRQIQFLDGRAADRAAECERYERAIQRRGGIDLQVLGLGANGHVGFNEPAVALTAATHRTRLTPATRRANARWFGNQVSEVPRHALSMGIATILHSRHIVLLATGARKAGCVARMINGPITTRLPASLLHVHPAVEVWIDRAAAVNLSRG